MPRMMMSHERPAVAPDIAVEFFRDAPWWRPVDHLPVDEDRTAALATLDQRIRTGGNTPLQGAGRSNTTVTTFPAFGIHRVPFPELVWTNAVINPDINWFGIDLQNRVYWELSSVRTGFFGWWAHGAHRWDLTRPWNQRNGLAGGGIAIWALIPRVGALRAGSGGVEHGLNISIAGDYAKAMVPWLTKTDGNLRPADHPLRAGECLRLTAEAYERLCSGETRPEALAVLWAARYRGVYVNDKTSARDGHAMRMPYGIELGLQLALARDFEVVAQ